MTPKPKTTEAHEPPRVRWTLSCPPFLGPFRLLHNAGLFASRHSRMPPPGQDNLPSRH